jgi:hypothetical protein
MEIGKPRGPTIHSTKCTEFSNPLHPSASERTAELPRVQKGAPLPVRRAMDPVPAPPKFGGVGAQG